MALNVLWPLIAQAKPKAPGLPVPLCTIDGVTHYLDLPAGKSPLEGRSNAHHEHCQLCVFGAERLAALPPASIAGLTAVERTHRPSFSVPAAAPDRNALPPAQPRAPPSLS